MKTHMILWPVVILAVSICFLLAPLLNAPDEYAFQARSLARLEIIEPNQIARMTVVWQWAHVGPVNITDKAVINRFVAMCNRDLSLERQGRGENLMHDKIILYDKSGRQILGLNFWLTDKQNGRHNVARNVRSRGEFKAFMNELMDPKY